MAGASASAAIATPSASVQRARNAVSASVRRAMVSAPITEPRLMIDIIVVKVVAEPSRSRVAKSGRITEKLKAIVPTAVTRSSGRRSSGWPHT